MPHEPNPAPPRRRLTIDATLVVLAAVLVATTWVRVRTGAGRPLWFDETWTGMIAAQPTFADFIHQCRLELNPPLFYLVTWLTAKLAGVSNAALRLPSLVFSVLAPLLPLVLGRALDRQSRLVWSGLLACWVPALWFAHDARGYAMLGFLAVLNTLAFVGALRRPGSAAALAWTLSGALLILTHYFGGFLLLAQAVVYVGAHRRLALAAWPAVIGLVPAAAWIAFHAGRLADAARLNLMAYPLIGSDHVLRLLAFVVGSPLLVALVAIWAAATLLAMRLSGSRKPVTAVGYEPLLAVAAAGGGLAIVVALATQRPILEPKYLTVFVPGLLLGLALCASAARRVWQTAGAVLLVLFASGVMLWRQQPDQRETVYSFEGASRMLMAADTTRLVFFWDHPLLPIEDADQLGQVGGFFLHRAGRPVPVEPVFPGRGSDPNPLLLAQAAPAGSAILWVYNTRVPGTAARAWPPVIGARDPRWACRDFGDGAIGILACTQREHGQSPR